LGRKAFSTNGVAEKIKKPYVHKKETHWKDKGVVNSTDKHSWTRNNMHELNNT
jgi:hypothetical protein